jgi:hypothetical protein
VRNFIIPEYNITYIDCSDLVVEVYLEVCKMKVPLCDIIDKDLKKLTFHYIVKELLKKNKRLKGRPVYFFNIKFINEFCEKKYIKNFLYSLKHLKSLLPIPLIFIDNDDIFLKNNGHLKGLNERITSHYTKHKKNTYKLRKYLESEDFYDLIKELSDIKNIKQLST